MKKKLESMMKKLINIKADIQNNKCKICNTTACTMCCITLSELNVVDDVVRNIQFSINDLDMIYNK